MSGKRIIYYLLAAFIAGNFLLLYIQYNASKNINTLIGGNEKVLAEINVTNNLRELNRDINSVDTTGTSPTLTDSFSRKELEKKISKVQSEIDNLQKISDDDTSVKYIDVLDLLVHEKLSLGKNLLYNHPLTSRSDAQKLNVTKNTNRLNDSIRLVSHVIENSRQKLLVNITAIIDKSGKNAVRLGITLSILVLVSGTLLFWFIVTAIRRQNHLIQQLNISEKKVKESALVKEKFMANMSHEIRTPMNAILGFTNLLNRKNLDEESKEYVRTIHNSGETLLTIINDILDLSKIEAGMMRIESAPFSISGLLHSIETMFTAKVFEKQLQLLITIDDTVPDILKGDSIRLTQILVNLIGNAIKFTNKGSISVKISNEGFAGNVIHTGITVIDTGIGIEEGKLKYIFERFQQAEDSATRKYGGTGLGLSIVDDLVKLQNGKIEVESMPGKGTTFHLIIPYKISTEYYVGNKTSSQNYTKNAVLFESKIILIVEDNEINQSLIKHLFKSWALKFEVVANGVEAIEKLQLKKYDLILMDIQMPEMDGYTATQEIRKKLKSDTPIIAMTAHALAGEREKCISYGMNEYISKPIREDQLYALIVRFTKNNAIINADTLSPINNLERVYNYIDLHYMKEISGGNTVYEKTVTEQFIESVPDNLQAIESAWKTNDLNRIKQFAHYMKTTISVMGLNDKLQLCLDALEYEELDLRAYNQHFEVLKTICKASLQEAKHFYSTL